MKRFFLLTACLLALTACTAAQTAVPAASPAPTEAPAATPTTVPFSVPAPYSDLSYLPELSWDAAHQKQTYQPGEYDRLSLNTYSFNDRTAPPWPAFWREKRSALRRAHISITRSRPAQPTAAPTPTPFITSLP